MELGYWQHSACHSHIQALVAAQLVACAAQCRCGARAHQAALLSARAVRSTVATSRLHHLPMPCRWPLVAGRWPLAADSWQRWPLSAVRCGCVEPMPPQTMAQRAPKNRAQPKKGRAGGGPEPEASETSREPSDPRIRDIERGHLFDGGILMSCVTVGLCDPACRYAPSHAWCVAVCRVVSVLCRSPACIYSAVSCACVARVARCGSYGVSVCGGDIGICVSPYMKDVLQVDANAMGRGWTQTLGGHLMLVKVMSYRLGVGGWGWFGRHRRTLTYTPDGSTHTRSSIRVKL